MIAREQLPNRRPNKSFTFEVTGLRYTATVSYFADGRIGELFLNNHKTDSAADMNARDAAITFSIAVRHGADAEIIRKALSRDNAGNATGVLGAALDLVARDGTMIADPVIAVARLVERLLAEISCAKDRSELFDLERHATEAIAALPLLHHERLGERIADAVREWLELNEIRREDE